MSLRLAPALVLAALIALCPVQTRANTVALDFTSPGDANKFSDATLGWGFSLGGTVSVTDLGVWDGNNGLPLFSAAGDGLLASHTVTIWDNSGNFITSATVPTGTTGTLINNFRYVSLLSPVLLPAGDYVIGAHYNFSAFPPIVEDDWLAVPANGITTASGVTYNGSRSAVGNAFPSGDVLGHPNGYFGPNFQFTTSVPDTGTTFPLFGLSLMGLAFLRRKFSA